MKKGETAKIDAAWWKKNKARTLKSTGLEAALKTCEKALKKAKTDTCGKPDIADALRELANVDAVAKKAAGMCNKKLQGETLAALQTFRPLIQKETTLLTTKSARIDKELKVFSAAAKIVISKLTAANRSIFALTKGMNEEAESAKAASGVSKQQIEIWTNLAKVGLRRASDQAKAAEQAYKDYGKVGDGLSRNLYLGHSREVVAIQRAAQKARSDVERTFPDAKDAAGRLIKATKAARATAV